MSRRKTLTDTSLRADLVAELRECREAYAPIFKRIGAKHWLTEMDAQIAALESEDDVLLQDWELMHALPPDEARAVNAIGGTFVVHADDTYEPAAATRR
jgi:hypothetical protein